MAKKSRRRGKRTKSRKKVKKRPDLQIIMARRAMVLHYLADHPCVDCGEKDLVVLQFDHVRGKKIENISLMIRLGYSEEAIHKEIAKCEVRCANCHARRTAIQQNWTKARYQHD
jgi:hypothetical protein